MDTPLFPEQPDASYPAPPTGPPTGPPAQRSPRRRWRGLLAGAVAGGVLGAAVATPITWAATRDDTPAATSSASGNVTTDQAGRFGQGGSGTYAVPPTLTDPGTVSPFGGSSGSSGSSGSGAPGSTDGSTSDAATATDATDAQSAGVVLIDTTLNGGTGAGTGLVIDSSGLVLTNYHVVEDSTDVQVTIATTGTTYTGTVVGHDEVSDVALVQLADASDLTTVDLDDDAGATVGEEVTAIGNAEGQGYLSASSGTVQALDQAITTSSADGGEGEDLTGLLEMNAAVVGGYSGGALLDAEGEVVGITTAASSGGVSESYAVPIADALSVVDQIESGTETGNVEIGPAAYLGVALASDSATLQVGEVESGTPAASAGIVAGDTLTSVDGTPVATYAALSAALATYEPGDRVSIGWTDTSGAAQTATVTLGSSPVN